MKEPRRSEVLVVAHAMLGGGIGLLEGVRELSRLGASIGEDGQHDDALLWIVAVDDDIEHLVFDDEHRVLCSQDRLRRSDEEKAAYLAGNGDSIRQACRELIAALEGS